MHYNKHHNDNIDPNLNNMSEHAVHGINTLVFIFLHYKINKQAQFFILQGDNLKALNFKVSTHLISV